MNNQTFLAMYLQLLSLVEAYLPKLEAISEESFSAKLNPERWSKKEILGHLIDSATYNHQRFIRAQFERSPTILYHPDNCVLYNSYQQSDTKTLIQFWAHYNRHIAHVISQFSTEQLQKTCITDAEHSLMFLFEDYIEHHKHHLAQIVE